MMTEELFLWNSCLERTVNCHYSTATLRSLNACLYPVSPTGKMSEMLLLHDTHVCPPMTSSKNLHRHCCCWSHSHIFTWLVFWKMSCEDTTTRWWGTEKCHVSAAGENEECISLAGNTCSCLKVETDFWQRWRVQYIEKLLCLQQCCNAVLWNVPASTLYTACNEKQEALFWLIYI